LDAGATSGADERNSAANSGVDKRSSGADLRLPHGIQADAGFADGRARLAELRRGKVGKQGNRYRCLRRRQRRRRCGGCRRPLDLPEAESQA